MDFLTALREAKRTRGGLRPAGWTVPFESYDGPVDLRTCAYRPYRYRGQEYLHFCPSGTLKRTSRDTPPSATLLHVDDLLGEWEVVTEATLNQARMDELTRLKEAFDMLEEEGDGEKGE